MEAGKKAIFTRNLIKCDRRDIKLIEFESKELGTIKLIGDKAEEFPMWSINRYIDETCNNYNKILIITKICELLQNGAIDSQFVVAKKSVMLFPKKSIKELFEYKEDNYIKLTTKDNNPEAFWHIIFNYSRPIVFFCERNTFTPIIDFKDEDAIKVTSLSYNSPPIFDISGAIETLYDLALAGKQDEREEEEHIARQLGESADNYRRIASASQVINDVRTPDGVRQYAMKGLEEIQEKQNILNKKLGIRIANINKKI